jgi:hypothetical protein
MPPSTRKAVVSTEPQTLSEEDLAALKWAHRHLEHPSFAARLSNAIGSPIEQGLRLLPKRWYQRVNAAAEAAIAQTLKLAIESMGRIPPSSAHDPMHKLMAAASGAVGGLFGPLALVAELPVITTLMLRSIADIAHAEGEDLSTTEARLACMQVFALGGRTGKDEAAETGYYGLRVTLSFHFSASLLHLDKISTKNIPAGIELVRAITSRFGVVVSDKAAAQMIPVAGAVGGALLNLIFMQHFQDIGRGHFIVRRLERTYGAERIREEYERLNEAEADASKEFSPLEGW